MERGEIGKPYPPSLENVLNLPLNAVSNEHNCTAASVVLDVFLESQKQVWEQSTYRVSHDEPEAFLAALRKEFPQLDVKQRNNFTKNYLALQFLLEHGEKRGPNAKYIHPAILATKLNGTLLQVRNVKRRKTTSEKKYPCAKCEKLFSTASNRTRHQRACKADE